MAQTVVCSNRGSTAIMQACEPPQPRKTWCGLRFGYPDHASGQAQDGLLHHHSARGVPVMTAGSASAGYRQHAPLTCYQRPQQLYSGRSPTGTGHRHGPVLQLLTRQP